MNKNDENKFEGPWIQTSMATVSLNNPSVDDIHIEDIAHSLSLICRFGGHCNTFYSVAQHSVLVSTLVDDPELQLIALLHDATEAYIGDIITPLKKILSQYTDIEDKFHLTIGEKFGLGDDLVHLPPAVKYADVKALKTEVRDLMGGESEDWKVWPDGMVPDEHKIIPLPPKQAAELFLERYATLTQKVMA